METTRFETFFDAILAIIITVLVLKIPQPASPTLEAFLHLNPIYIAYLISFLVLYNIWYANHNLFQVVDTIDNTALWIYGLMTFVISLLPYFTIWLANNVHSIPPETMFGLIFIITHILNTLATRAIYRSNPYNKQLHELNFNSYYMNLPTIVLIIGFILTYTIFVPGIYICCLLSVVLWILLGRLLRRHAGGN
ncbi:TMEM175 family protein [Methanobrevibacter sp. YE315]|uniref:TMEM175 family protein n=1 Tax=Methanobrevibacter sp. YE315 TaxID=1609968 RepID=UPI0009E7FEDE|nr:TMEM175 family protein [Methanobrevibacter sp. YE315]